MNALRQSIAEATVQQAQKSTEPGKIKRKVTFSFLIVNAEDWLVVEERKAEMVLGHKRHFNVV